MTAVQATGLIMRPAQGAQSELDASHYLRYPTDRIAVDVSKEC